jgi:hypothetical protein
MMISTDELFQNARVAPTGMAKWGDVIPEVGSGVYVVSIAHPASVTLDSLPEREREYWDPQQSIIYIGRAARLSRRLSQFYRHEYGDRSPHHGGQAILKITCPKRIDCAAVDDYADAEHRLIEAFQTRAEGRMPFGNRVRSARIA